MTSKSRRVRIRNRLLNRSAPAGSPTVVGPSPTLQTRGLIATCDIGAGELIERSPVVLIPMAQERALKATILANYYFHWTDDHHALAMGYGGLINHSYAANANYRRDIANEVLEFRAVKPIRRGEEVTINYNGTPDDPTPIDRRYGIPKSGSVGLIAPGALDADAIREHFGVDPVAYLGSGSFGDVWRVRAGTDDLVLKLLEIDAPRRRWQREVEAYRAVRSSRIPEMLDAGELHLSGSVVGWLKLQFVDGASLGSLMRCRIWPTADDLTQCARGLLEAVGDTHAAGLVFRDISPDNIVLDGNRWDQPFLIDLGMAIRSDAPEKERARGVGTVAYTAPEQVREDPVTPATDLFGVGVVCYKLASGGLHPFLSAGERLSTAEAQERIAAGPRPLPAAQAANEPWIRGLLAFDPAERSSGTQF